MPSYDTPRPVTARIDLAVGELQVRAAARDTTVVEVRPTDPTDDHDVRAADGTRVELVDDRLQVRTPRLRSWVGRNVGSVDVVVELPAGSSLDATTGVGDVTCDGALDECRVKTGIGHVRVDEAASLHVKCGAGDVTVERVRGHADVVDASGRVAVRELGSTGALRNSNGATWVGDAAGELRIHAANGDIAVERADAGVVAKSANGDVRLEDVGHGSVVAETQVGDLDIGIRPGASAWLDLDARAGTVHNSLDTAERPDGSTDTVQVRGRTTLGEIVIRRPRGVADAR